MEGSLSIFLAKEKKLAHRRALFYSFCLNIQDAGLIYNIRDDPREMQTIKADKILAFVVQE